MMLKKLFVGKLWYFWNSVVALLLMFSLGTCKSTKDFMAGDMARYSILKNEAAYIPLQCYTKTKHENDFVGNSCYVCHTVGERPNRLNDSDLQKEYAFPAFAETNNWGNSTQDRSSKTKRISDHNIMQYIRQNNYIDENRNIILKKTLAHPKTTWDSNSDGRWSGVIPDVYFDFDDKGFDRNPQGQYTGWRAYAYYPFPTTHWPTNGSFSDGLIRLPEEFRQKSKGKFDKETYIVNLAIVESLVKKEDIPIDLVDENIWGVDLNKDGRLGDADRVAYDWAPLENQHMSYVGVAKDGQEKGDIRLAAGLFPLGTEFVSTLRYIDLDEYDTPKLSARLKEFRHFKKTAWLTYAELETVYLDEAKERSDFPDRLRMPVGSTEAGVSNNVGWKIQAFIEDRKGDLRPQSFEELVSCIGCHGGIGEATDSIISFPRKFEATKPQRGWTHWTQHSLQGVNEPKVEIKDVGVQYEYSFYLMYTGAGDDYKANQEILNTFYYDNGKLDPTQALLLHQDISILLYPSPSRALQLNKIYKTIVEDQSYIKGRDPIIGKAFVHEKIEEKDIETGVEDLVIITSGPGHFHAETHPLSDQSKLKGEWKETITESGMGGPSGELYGADWSGFIRESSYKLNLKNFYFPFPKRHTRQHG